MKRVFLIVLDSLGIGAAPDAAAFGDAGADTMRSISASPFFSVQNMKRYGLAEIDGLSYLGCTGSSAGAVARLEELSAGKDTTVGHWELAGLVSKKPFPTYPNGFPDFVISEFSDRCGRGVLCNRPYSGTEVIRDFGDEHVRTGKLIVYTSADSVFQIAAHEDVVPVEELYRYCMTAREILVGDNAVGRVIARPFSGKSGSYFRTASRRDFSLPPQGVTVLDELYERGYDVISVGKINDIFAGRGITESHPTHSNAEGMETAKSMLSRDFSGLCFVNLVDFDMLWGHRNDIDGYARGVSEFDAWLPSFVSGMRSDDVLMITADHGCDPGYPTTDHTRERVPLLIIGERVERENFGTVKGFSFVAEKIREYLLSTKTQK